MENTESPSQSESSQKSGGSKSLIISIVVVLLLLLGIGGYMILGRNSTKPVPAQVVQDVPSPTPDNSFSSITEALSKSLSLQCDYTDDAGSKIMSYMKNGAIRSDITAKNAKVASSMIIKDKKMYYWTGITGSMMEFDMTTMMTSVTPSAKKSTTSTQQKPEDVLGSLEKFKQFCTPTVIDDALFTPPTDVKFTDLSSVMKAVTKITPGATGGVMTEEQIKQLQEQAGQ